MSWKKLTPAAMKKITSDWNESFDAFGVYKQLHLLRRVGPLLMGVALEKGASNDFYKPTFHVHNLAKAFPVITLSQPRRVQNEYIQTDWHDSKYPEIANRLESEAYLPLEGDLSLEQVIEGFYTYLKKPFTPYEPDVYKDLALICGWAGDLDKAQTIAADAEKTMRRWPSSVLSQIGGLYEWISSLNESCRDTDGLKKTVDREIRNHKLVEIPTCRLL